MLRHDAYPLLIPTMAIKGHRTQNHSADDFRLLSFTLDPVLQRYNRTITPEYYALLSLCDGTRTLAEILACFDPDSHEAIIEAFQGPECQIILDWYDSPQNGFRPFQVMPPATQKVSLSTITFHITNVCNFRCEHCYHNDYEMAADLTLDEIRDLAVQMAEANVCEVILTGGEPFLRDDLVEMVRVFNAHYIAVIINTNGFLVTDAHIEALRECPFVLLSISVDGPNEAVHNRIRKHPLSWQKITELLPRLEAAQLGIGISTMLSRPWLPLLEEATGLDAFITYLNQFRIERWILTDVAPTGEAFTGDYTETLALKPADTVRIGKAVLDSLSRLQPQNILFAFIVKIYKWAPGQSESILPLSGFHYKSEAEARENILCEEHKTILYMESDGLVPFCTFFKSRFPLSIGHLRNESLEAIWDKLCALRMDYTIPKRKFCGGCSLLKYCGGGCPGEDTSPDADILTGCDHASRSVLPLVKAEYEQFLGAY